MWPIKVAIIILLLFNIYNVLGELSGWLSGKESACQCRRCRRLQVQSLGQEDVLEEEMETYSSIFAWEVPWTEEPDGLQFIGLQRVKHD